GLFAGFTATCELPAASFAVALFVLLLLKSPRRALLGFAPAALLPVAALLLTNYLAIGELAPAYGTIDSPWYRYEGSHWLVYPVQVKRGIDFLNEPKWLYAFHLLFGHHGLFSLTPIVLLSAAGAVWAVVKVLRTFLHRKSGLLHWLRGLPAMDLTAGL